MQIPLIAFVVVWPAVAGIIWYATCSHLDWNTFVRAADWNCNPGLHIQPLFSERRAPGHCVKTRAGIHSFSFFLTWKSTAGWKLNESSVRKWSIHSLSISAYLFNSASQGAFVVIIGAKTQTERANLTGEDTHLRGLVKGTVVDRNRPAPSAVFNDRPPTL